MEMTNEELQKMLTSFEEEVSHIKQWEIDRNERMRAQAKYANQFVKTESRRKGGLTNVKTGHCKRIARLGGISNSKSGHIQKLQPIGTKAAADANKKEIVKLDKNGNIIKFYESLKEASLDNNRTQSTISNNIAGRTKYCGGFKYKFK